MLDIKRIINSDQMLKALTGLSTSEFKQLLPIFEGLYYQQCRQVKPRRQRAIGGGRKHTLQSMAERLFFILFYHHCHPTMTVAGLFFGVDRSRIQRWVKRLSPILAASLGKELVLPGHQIDSIEAFRQQFPQVKGLFVDSLPQ